MIQMRGKALNFESKNPFGISMLQLRTGGRNAAGDYSISYIVGNYAVNNFRGYYFLTFTFIYAILRIRINFPKCKIETLEGAYATRTNI